MLKLYYISCSFVKYWINNMLYVQPSIDRLQEETGKVPPNFLQEIYKWALECKSSTFSWTKYYP